MQFRIVSVSQEAKKKGISRSMAASEAKAKVPDLFIIPKGTRFNKPESKLLRISSYKLRNSILEFFNWHAPEGCFEGDDDISNIIMAINGSDEFFLDLSKPAECFVETNDEPNLDSRRKVIFECKLNKCNK